MSISKSSIQTKDPENSLDSKEGWFARSRFLSDDAEPVGTVYEVEYFHVNQTISLDKYGEICHDSIQKTLTEFFSHINSDEFNKKEDLDYRFNGLKSSILSEIESLYNILKNNEEVDKFQPRWGKYVFTCEYCGAEGLQLTEVSSDEWMPFDLINNKVHQCLKDKYKDKPTQKEIYDKENALYRSKNVEGLSLDSVIQQLQTLGFESYIPRTSSWKHALIASNLTQTIYFLIGNKGIDFKFYDQLRETKVDKEGKLFTDGGEMTRNYYRESDVNIHELTLEIASQIVTNAAINMSSHGFSGLHRSLNNS